MIEVVVARYQEDLAWVKNLPTEVRVTIYDKSGSAPEIAGATVISRPNEGVEAETYLHHLESRFDDLATWTVFCQGHPFDHAPKFHKVVRAMVRGELPEDPFRWLGFFVDSDDPRGRRLFVPWSKNKDGRELDLARFYRELFEQEAPAWTHFYGGAQFVLGEALARSRPRDFYARARRLAIEFPDGGHCFERTWDRVFGVQGVDPEWLGGELTRYLKPIRRLQTGDLPSAASDPALHRDPER